MGAYADTFLSTLLLSFAAFTLFAGLFTAYFGTGKSRTIGYVLTLVALLAGFVFAMLVWEFVPGVTVIWETQVVLQALVAVVAASVGAVASLAVFLASIMKA